MIYHDVFFSGWKIFKAVIECNTEQKIKSVKKVITYLEMNLEAIFLEHLELYIGGNFFLSKKFFTIFSIIVTNSLCAVLAIRALFLVLKQEIIFLNSKLIGNLKNLVIATKAKKFNLISLFEWKFSYFVSSVVLLFFFLIFDEYGSTKSANDQLIHHKFGTQVSLHAQPSHKD